MRKGRNRILSFLVALVMIISSIVSPVTVVSAAENEAVITESVSETEETKSENTSADSQEELAETQQSDEEQTETQLNEDTSAETQHDDAAEAQQGDVDAQSTDNQKEVPSEETTTQESAVRTWSLSRAAAGTSLDTSNLTFDVANPAGYVTISFVDNGIRPDDASISDTELYGTAVGTIIKETEVPYVAGDSIAAVTVRLFNAMGLDYDADGTVTNGFYLQSLNDFELNNKYYATFGEFDAGNASGWCVRLNNWHINQSAAAIKVEDGDIISWLYTCQWGADIGADFSSKSAEITGIKFTSTDMTLDPVFDKEETSYEMVVDENTKAIAFELLLENYASVVTLKVDGNTVKYRPNKDIAVTRNSKIEISTALDYMDAANNNQVTTYIDSITIQLTSNSNQAPIVGGNTAPNIKAAYAEEKGKTYIYSSSVVYIYMDEIFEDADGDALTYKATLDGKEVEITYNSWSKQYYIQFATKPAIREYKIVANDGKADSEVFTATCIGTSATITAPENSPLMEGGNYYYYVMGSAPEDTFAFNYALDVDAEVPTEWTSSNTNTLTSNGDGTFTVGNVTTRQSLYVGVTSGKDSWGSAIYLGTKNMYIIPANPEFIDITAELSEHADNTVDKVEANAVSGGWYGTEFEYTTEDPSICDITTSGNYGLKVTPKKLGTTTVTATFKYDDSIQGTFDVTVTGHSLQIKDRPDTDSVILGKDKTVQMEVLGAADEETFTWTSGNEDVATVDEKGLVTVKALGTSYITATSSLSTEDAPVKASMYLQVKEDGKVYLDDLAITDYSNFEGFISAKSGFNSATLEYNWSLQESKYTYNKLAFTPYFDDETLDAVLHYQVSGGEEQTMALTDGTAVSITNGLNPGNNTITIDVYPTDDEENVTTYTLHIFRTYNPSNTITGMTVYPNGNAALAYPTYLDNKEGTIYQYNPETDELITGWNSKPSTTWSSTVYNYKTYVFDARTSSISLYPTFAYTGQRVMIYVNGEALEEAVTNWKSSVIPVEAGETTKIELRVLSEKAYAEKEAEGVEDPFAEPENTYTIYVETVTPLGIDAQILSAELSVGEFYKPGFSKDTYIISALIPSDETSTELTFTVPDGIDVYKTSVSDANKLVSEKQDEDGNNIYTTETVQITGTGVSAYSTTNIILQVADEDGNIGKVQYAFTVSKRGAKDVYPDSIVEYLCIGSQYTNASSYGTMPERTLKENGGVLSLGNFGGYIIYKYDTPIENSSNNPYGVDFVIYGNSFGNGGHEPGYVQVSKDGETWYTLAGSEHFDDHNDWDYTMTYTNNNGKSAWTNSDGESGTNYNYPVASAYPYFTWTEELEQSMTVSGPRLNSSAKDAYGSAAAVLPVFGYVDVNTNGTINGTSNNPYNHPGTLVAGGDMFDLDWAVDENGMPVELDNISYIRVATASSIYAGAIGEKSTEVTTVNRVTNAAETAVGETTAPTAITINGETITVPANGKTQMVKVSPVASAYEEGEEEEEIPAVLTVSVTVGEESNVYINNLGASERSYVTMPEKGIIRIIVQEGEKEPYICYVLLDEAASKVEDLIAAIGEVTLESEEAIEAAREAYEALTEAQKALVENEEVLTNAEKTLADLEAAKEKEEADKKAAEEVENLIGSIGEVTLESENAIKEARKAYEALSVDQKVLVGNLDVLKNAEKTLAQLQTEKEELEANQKAAEEVENLIGAIGEVTLESEEAIKEAREAYEALTEAQKALVENEEVLTKAEKTLADLKAAKEKEEADKKAAEEVENLIGAIGEVTLESESAIKEAREAYEALSVDQKVLVGNLDVLKNAEKTLAQLQTEKEELEANQKAAEEVENLIGAIGEVTLESEEAIEATREAYEALTEAQKALVENEEVLTKAEKTLADLKAAVNSLQDIYKATGDYLEQTAKDYPPTVSATGGDWLILGLARSGKTISDEYYKNVVAYVQEKINDKEQLHRAKSTDNSRVILALTAAGYDVTDVGGHNLLVGLTDMDYVTWQGNNGAIWALIAFDSHDYEIPTAPEGANQVTREKLIASILDAQLEDGGWNTSTSATVADVDMTAMAIQALAPYYDSDAEVKAAVDQALDYLSKQQYADGSFGSVDGKNSESCAQVLVALTALGINPETDARFIKNGNSVVDALCTYYVEGGGFKHLQSGERDGMATEQGYYALVAYMRSLNGQTSLYDMTDVVIKGSETDEPGTDEPGTDEPGTDEPGTDEPGTDEPGTDTPGTDNSGTNNSGTNNSGTSNSGTTNQGSTSTGTSTGTTTTTTAKTGDETPIMSLVVMMLAAGMMVCVVLKKKRENV